jgi:hypothetical protein
LWDEQVARLEISDELIGLSKRQTRIDWAVNNLHRKRLIRSQCLEIWEIGFDKHNTVIALISPQFEEMNHVAEP